VFEQVTIFPIVSSPILREVIELEVPPRSWYFVYRRPTVCTSTAGEECGSLVIKLPSLKSNLLAVLHKYYYYYYEPACKMPSKLSFNPMATKRSFNPFKRSAKTTDRDNCKGHESFNTTSTVDIDSSYKSLSPVTVSREFKSIEFLSVISPTPVYEENEYEYTAKCDDACEGNASPPDNATAAAQCGYEDHSPNNVLDLGYGDATPDVAAKHGYEGRHPPPRSTSFTTPRRSSMKQGCGGPRRSSIQFSGEVEVMLPGKNKSARRRTSITFDGNVKVKKVTSVHDLTEEPESLWFQDEEYNRMKEKSFSLVDKVEQCGGLGHGRKYCTRGLENLMSDAHEEVQNTKYDGWDSVLNEQNLQRKQGTYDDEYMAKVYKFATFKNQKDAANRARQDAQEIEAYLKK
jgi:hypothetical protein